MLEAETFEEYLTLFVKFGPGRVKPFHARVEEKPICPRRGKHKQCRTCKMLNKSAKEAQINSTTIQPLADVHCQSRDCVYVVLFSCGTFLIRSSKMEMRRALAYDRLNKGELGSRLHRHFLLCGKCSWDTAQVYVLFQGHEMSRNKEHDHYIFYLNAEIAGLNRKWTKQEWDDDIERALRGQPRSMP